MKEEFDMINVHILQELVSKSLKDQVMATLVTHYHVIDIICN